MCDVKCHMECKHHVDGAKAFSTHSTMTGHLREKQQSLDKQVTTAKLYFTTFVAGHF